jgi:hypothetical protein
VDDDQLRSRSVADRAVPGELGELVPPLGRQLIEAAAADLDDE